MTIPYNVWSGKAPLRVAPVAPIALGYRQVADLDAPAGIPDLPVNADRAVINVSGSGVRWRDDGLAPTAALGMPVAAGSTFVIEGDLTAVLFLGLGKGAVLDVALYSSSGA